mmetsp:Transcript_45250/g.117538  ORF Transcript_45250/g.117538 Transcript_45250/m.117538 type:complete len:293 (+) Transcript_45250:75-953(+)
MDDVMAPAPGADVGNTMLMSGNPFGAAAGCTPQQSGPNLQRLPATQFQQQQQQPQSQPQLSQGQQQQMVAVMMPNQMGMQMPQGGMPAMSGAAGSSASGQNGAMQAGMQGADRSLQQMSTLSSDNLPANATLAGGNFPPGTINLGPGTGPNNQFGYYVAIPIGPAAPQGGGGVAAAPGNWAPGGPGGGFVQMPDGFSAAGGSRPGFGGDEGDYGGRGRTFGRGGFDAGKGAFGAGKGAAKGFAPQQKFGQVQPQAARTGNADMDDNWRSRTAADAEAAKDAMAAGADFGAPA